MINDKTRRGWVVVHDGIPEPILWNTRKDAIKWWRGEGDPKSTIRRATLIVDPVKPRKPKRKGAA